MYLRQGPCALLDVQVLRQADGLEELVDLVRRDALLLDQIMAPPRSSNAGLRLAAQAKGSGTWSEEEVATLPRSVGSAFAEFRRKGSQLGLGLKVKEVC